MKLVATALVLVVTLAACGPSTPRADAEGSVATAQAATRDTSLPVMTVYKTPTCGCCKAWVDHVKENGFAVEVHDLNDLSAIKKQHGVPAALNSCHTAVVGRYVIEGHVPAGDIRKLLYEKPDIAGLAVPGMPAGSPGMEGFYKEKYDVFAFTEDGKGSVFASH